MKHWTKLTSWSSLVAGVLVGVLSVYFALSSRQNVALLGLMLSGTGALVLVIIRRDQLLRELQAKADAVNRSEERLRFALRSARMIAWEWNPRTGEYWTSESVDSWLGLPEGTFSPQEGLLSVVHPEDRERLRVLLKESESGQVPRDGELRLRGGGGRDVWAQIRARPVLERDGRPTGWLAGTVLDVTAEHQAQTRLRLLESAVLHAHDAIVVFDADPQAEGVGRAVRFVNEAFCRLTGYSREELLGQSLHKLRGPATDPSTLERIRAALDAGTSLETELLNYRKDGTPVWVELSLVPVPVTHGKPVQWIMVQRDVTERRRTAEALRQSEERLRAIFDNSQAGIAVCDPQGRLLQFNRRFAGILACEAEELLGRCLSELTHPEDVARESGLLAAVAQGLREEAALQKRHLRKDGREVWVDVYYSGVKDVEGRVTHIIGVVLDITERRRLEEHLRQATKLEAIGQMAGGIAHDFNNLLTAALGNLGLIRLAADDPNRPLVKAAEVAATRAADLTRKLLGYARRNQLMLMPVDPAEVLEEAAALLKRTLDPRIRIVVNVEPDCGQVLADATLLNQAVLNLCLNARDAMPEGGTITLTAGTTVFTPTRLAPHPEGQAGEYVLISVADTGCGIPDDIKPRLFEPFFTTKPVGHGTGLGLAMVQGIVKQHNGWIECHSRPGQGSRFDLYLPRIGEDAVDQPRPVHLALPTTPSQIDSKLIGTDSKLLSSLPANGHAAEAAGGDKGTILLVDDEEMIRDLGKTILETAGYRVLTATDGEDAIALFEREHANVELVILDVTMPRMSGRDACKQLLRISPNTRIIFSTGYSADSLTELDGALGLLSKPYRPQEMVAAVHEALSRPGAGLAATAS